MDKDVHNYFSVLSDSLIEPIVTLVEKATSSRLAGANDVQASCIENGYSTAIILLLIVYLEGVSNYLWLHHKDLQPKMKKYKAIEAIKLYAEDLDSNIIEELFIMRDVIAHNHIWEARIESSKGIMKHIDEPSLLHEYGDEKYRKCVDFNKRSTKLLKLNVFTTRINWLDVEIVFENVMKIIRSIEKNLKLGKFNRVEHYQFDGFWIHFEDLITEVNKKRAQLKRIE